MDIKENLQQLKKLQITDKNETLVFSKHAILLKWIDKVAPLLKYNNEHYRLFMDAALRVSIPGISSRTADPCLNIMKGVVNRAITELENDITSPQDTKKEELKYPDKITLKWLRDHVPAHFFWSFVLILFFMFCLGLKFADTKLYKSLIETYTASDNTVKKIVRPNK